MTELVCLKKTVSNIKRKIGLQRIFVEKIKFEVDRWLHSRLYPK